METIENKNLNFGLCFQTPENLSNARGDLLHSLCAHATIRLFPKNSIVVSEGVKELTRVTELVASRHQMLARDFERRILARTSSGNLRPQWLSQAALPASSQSVRTTTADARR